VIKHFSPYLALRYLRPKRTFVSVITIISILGVAAGVAILIIVIGIMRGFHGQIMDLAQGYEAHIEAVDSWGTSMMPSGKRPPEARDRPWRDVLQSIRATPGVISASPMVRGLVLVESQEGMAPSAMWGVKEDDGNRLVEKHKNFIKEGTLDLTSDTVALDSGYAAAFHVNLGDKITAYAPSNLKELVQKMREIDEKPEAERAAAYKELKELMLPLDLTVSAIIEPPSFQDSSKMPIIIVPLHVAQELRGLDDGITSIGIELTHPYQAGPIRNQLMDQEVLPSTWSAYTWMEAHERLFAAVQNELMMMYVILSFISLVAALCVMNTMITVTVQKRREIGIVAALGSRIGQIMSVFIIQGMIVGTFGALAGLGLGVLITSNLNHIRDWMAQTLNVQLFDQAIYGLVEVPSKVLPHDVGIICIGAFVLCTLAALVPAWLAARIEPAVALRD
jgi:lipoprotein-releasing system permease protein